jgi:hypothetical protein
MLSTAGEAIRWTQTLELSEGKLTFAISGESSVTWGKGFAVSTRADAPGLVNLNAYSPKISVMYTRHWGLGVDRVKMIIDRIEKYDAKGVRISDDPTDYVVFPH